MGIRNLLSSKKYLISGGDNATYWSEHNVTLHHKFKNSQESLDYFHWRNAQYFNYIQLMPVTGLDGKVVLDYGCGPGHDLVGFGCYSKPQKLIGMDLSPVSLAETQHRLSLHQITADLIQVTESNNKLPLDDCSVDYIHCSGVLHHAAKPEVILQEFKRILKPQGEIRVMVYYYHSLWVHLYVAYIKQIAERSFKDFDIKTAFSKTTDGPDCPISNVYTKSEFIDFAKKNNFDGLFLGAAISMWEMSLLNRRFEAVMNQHLSGEHRDFLLALTFDAQGYPMYKGHYAGIDGCYILTPRL